MLLTGIIMPDPEEEEYPPALTDPDPLVEASLDWSQRGLVSSVKNQVTIRVFLIIPTSHTHRSPWRELYRYNANKFSLKDYKNVDTCNAKNSQKMQPGLNVASVHVLALRLNEPPHGTNNMHMRKQRRRSASQ